MEGTGDSDFGAVSSAQARVGFAPDLGGHTGVVGDSSSLQETEAVPEA